MHEGRLALGALTLATVFIVTFYHYDRSSVVLLQQEILSQDNGSPDSKFFESYAHSERKQAKDSVEGAAQVNARFGGSFENGVGSNTWKGTPWSKYDKAVKGRKDMLVEMPSIPKGVVPPPTLPKRVAKDSTETVSNPDDPSERAPKAVRMQAVEAPKDIEYTIDPRESLETTVQREARMKEEISNCLRGCSMALCEEACKAIGNPSKLDDIVQMPKAEVPVQQVAHRPAEGWRSFIEKCEDTCKTDHCKEMCRASGAHERENKEVEEHEQMHLEEPKAEMSDDIIPAPAHLKPILPPPFPFAIEKMNAHDAHKGGAAAADSARMEDLAEVPEVPGNTQAKANAWYDQDSFHQARHDHNAVPVQQKEFFWQGLGDATELSTSKGRSEKPIDAAETHAAADRAPTEMLFQENASPYYLDKSAGQEQDGGNPYATGWDKVRGTNLNQVDAAINDQLQPLAQEYPYLRAIRH